MADEIVVRPSKFIHRLVVIMSIFAIIFLFWLGLSSGTMAGLVPAGVAIVWCGVTAAIIKQPFQLIICVAGLTIKMPHGGSFIAWESFQQFAVRRADPWTTYIAYKLKPEVKTPWYYRRLGRGGWHGALFPYFEISNKELLQLLRKYQYKGHTRLIL